MAEAEAELLGGGGKKGGKRQKRGASAAEEASDEEDAFFTTLSLQGQLPKYAELLKFKSLSVGAKLWGAVTEVTPRELVVSLPHGLRGHVAYAEASDWLAEQSKKAAAAGEGAAAAGGKRKKGGATAAHELPALMDLFSIGQLVRCVVAALHDGGDEDAAAQQSNQQGAKKGGGARAGGKRRKRIDLSLHVAAVNEGLGPEALKEGFALPACVRSVEDHGYLLGLGIKGAPTAFLPRKAAPAGARLAPGSLVEVVVSAPAKAEAGAGRSGPVIVSGERDAVAGAAAREWEGLNIGSLLPGALVTARVRNVLGDGLLASFLTYFTATVDPFHLGWAGADWRKHFSPQQRLRARILYVDPSSKRVGLTLLPHLLACSLPENFPLLGQVFEAATVLRVDPGLGLLCTLPPPAEGGPPLAPGFAHISNLADERVEEVERRFRPTQRVRCRVIGFRPMDGLAALSLKPSVVDQHILSLADLRPGMPVSATVDRVEDHGLLCHVTSTIRAAVPLLHVSDVPSWKALRKFKEGQKVSGRDAMPGSRSHGVVTGVQDFGVFVSFYGGVAGLAHVSECGLPIGQKPGQAYEAGQAVKVHVLGVDAGKKGLRLSLVSKRKAVDAEAEAVAAAAGGGEAVEVSAPRAVGDALGGYQPGSVVHGVVTAVHMKEGGDKGAAEPAYFEVAVSGEQGEAAAAAGRLDAAHLADHPAAVAALRDAVRVGSRLGPLLVLQRLEGAKKLKLRRERQGSRKASLLAAAGAGRLPSEFGQVAESAALQGYVASVTSDAVFVRFLGGLTGRAGLAQLSDTFVSDPHLHFSEGQSVRAQVAQVDHACQRFSLTLKQSLCGPSAAADAGEYLCYLFADLAAAEQLAAASGQGDEAASEVDWDRLFAIGTVVEGSVHDVKEYGILCDLQPHPDVVGLAAPHQVPEGRALAAGDPVHAAVLDFNRKDGIVDLSLLPELVEAAAAAAVAAKPAHKKSKKAKAEAAAPASLSVGARIECRVQLAKEPEGYCVAAVQPAVGTAEEGAAPSPLLLGFLPIADFNVRQHQLQHRLAPGNIITATVSALPSAATGGRLVVHVPLTAPALKAAVRTAVNKPSQQGSKATQPKHALPTPGTVCSAKVTAVHALHADITLESGCRGRLHITQVVDPPASSSSHSSSAASPLTGLKEGQQLEAVAVLGKEVEGGFVWCAFSPTIRGRAFLPEAASSLKACGDPSSAFRPGQAVEARALHVEPSKRMLDVMLGASRPVEPAIGAVVLGRLATVAGTGVVVQLGARSRGRVALNDIHDAPVANALAGLQAGQYVRAAVVAPADERGVVALSLRPSQGGECAAHKDAQPTPASGSAQAPASASQLAAGQVVGGYVKAVGPAGVFVELSRGLEARIKLSQLADTFVEQPAEAFLAGCRVDARVLHVVRGHIKRVEKYGVFVELVPPHAGVSGLAHVSELADEFVKDVASLFSVGQAVSARVLNVDAAKGRLSLGLKPSYLEGASSDEECGGAAGASEDDFDAELAEASSGSEDKDMAEGEEGNEAEAAEEGDSDADLDLDAELAEAESDGGSGSSSDGE
eukprot:scaffold19.g1742.t1